MEEMLNINGVEYVKKDNYAKIIKERDEAVRDLKVIKDILGKSFQDLASIITTDAPKPENEKTTVTKTIQKEPIIRSRPNDPFKPTASTRKLITIRHMDENGYFYSINNRKFSKINIKTILKIQQALHRNIKCSEVTALSKKLNLTYTYLSKIIYNYQEHVFDKYIAQWNKQTQPVVKKYKNKPIENNPQKRKESQLYI